MLIELCAQVLAGTLFASSLCGGGDAGESPERVMCEFRARIELNICIINEVGSVNYSDLDADVGLKGDSGCTSCCLSSAAGQVLPSLMAWSELDGPADSDGVN